MARTAGNDDPEHRTGLQSPMASCSISKDDRGHVDYRLLRPLVSQAMTTQNVLCVDFHGLLVTRMQNADSNGLW